MQLFDSTAKFNGRRSGQFNGRSGGLFNQPAPHGGATPAASARSQFLIYPFWIDISAVPYYAHVVNNSDKQKGTVYVIGRVTGDAGGTIRCMTTAFEGAMYPGVAFPFTPDSSSGTTTTTDGNSNLVTIPAGAAHDADYADWVVPDTFTHAANKANVWTTGGAGTNNWDLVRIRSGTPTTILSNQVQRSSTANPGYGYALSDTLEAGDTLRFRRTAGQGGGFPQASFVAHIQIYDDTGDCTDDAEHFIPAFSPQLGNDTTVQSFMNESSAETAIQLSPTGLPEQFLGGAAHQGPEGTYGQEFPTSTSWTKAGQPWTPEGGFQTDEIVMLRDSTMYYNAANPDMGDLSYVYTFRPNALFVEWSGETTIVTDTGSLYNAMLPARSATWTAASLCSPSGANVESFTSAEILAANRQYVGANATAGEAIFFEYLTNAGTSTCLWHQARTGTTMNRRDVEDRGAGTPGRAFKQLAAQNPVGNANAAGVLLGASLAYWGDSATGPTFPIPALT